MSRMVSLGTKVRQIHGLAGTRDVNEWENEFINHVWVWTKQGAQTSGLTEKQIGVIERIWGKHFA